MDVFGRNIILPNTAEHWAWWRQKTNKQKNNGQNWVERGTAKFPNTCFYLSSGAINSSQDNENSVEADVALFLWMSHALYIVSICWVTIYIIREMFKCVYVMIYGDSSLWNSFNCIYSINSDFDDSIVFKQENNQTFLVAWNDRSI